MREGHWLTQGDAVSLLTAWTLLLMSVLSWVLILWKGWLLWRAGRDLPRCTAAFWQSPQLDAARERLQAFDGARLLLPLVDALMAWHRSCVPLQAGTPATVQLGVQGDARLQRTRVLRDALQQAVQRLQAGQVWLATVGATAPFVGLLGTVWGIYLALATMTGDTQISIDRISGPVGEALVMTAAGLAVALPAVLAYNLMGRAIAQLEAGLEGFAHDLLGLAP
jgi:biopolymer transport protein ExbB